MKRRRPSVVALLAIASASASMASPDNSTAVSPQPALKYTSTNSPACSDDLARSLVALYGANRNVYEQCVAEGKTYSLFPYSGVLPTDAQIIAMVSSLSCLYFFQALLLMPLGRYECNLGGLDLRSTLETLLMTSQDVVHKVTPLTSDQLVQFMTWRHARNIAQETGQPYDAQSESAAAFDKQVVDSAKRLRVTLTDRLVIQVDGRSIGRTEDDTVTSDAEIRSVEVDSPDPGSVRASKGNATKPRITSSTERSGYMWTLSVAFLVLGVLTCIL